MKGLEVSGADRSSRRLISDNVPPPTATTIAFELRQHSLIVVIFQLVLQVPGDFAPNSILLLGSRSNCASCAANCTRRIL